MTTMRRDPLVDDYLRRLEAAVAHLPRARRAELVEEIEAHIDSALGETGSADPAAVRNVLERLGPPDEIAAAAGPPTPAPVRGRLESAALLVLGLSFLLPVLGYLIGAGLVVGSAAWDGREKLLGLLIPPAVLFGGGLVLALGAASGDSAAGLGPLEIAVVTANVLSGPLAAAYLSLRLPRP
jgi:hypothetical protein